MFSSPLIGIEGIFTDENNTKPEEEVWLALADPGGAPGTRPPPQGSWFFRFDIKILQNIAASGVGTPPTRWAPPYEKSWIRHATD